MVDLGLMDWGFFFAGSWFHTLGVGIRMCFCTAMGSSAIGVEEHHWSLVGPGWARVHWVAFLRPSWFLSELTQADRIIC
jgi:hypothetical protein